MLVAIVTMQSTEQQTLTFSSCSPSSTVGSYPRYVVTASSKQTLGILFEHVVSVMDNCTITLVEILLGKVKW